MSLEDLDRFLTLRDSDPDLAQALAQPMDLDRFLGLAAEHGFALSEADVFALHSSANTTRERQLSFSRIKPPNHAACAISSTAEHHHVSVPRSVHRSSH